LLCADRVHLFIIDVHGESSFVSRPSRRQSQGSYPAEVIKNGSAKEHEIEHLRVAGRRSPGEDDAYTGGSGTDLPGRLSQTGSGRAWPGTGHSERP